MTRDDSSPPQLIVPEPQSKWFKLSEWNSKHPLATPYPHEWVESRWRALAGELDVIRDAAHSAISVTPNGGFRNEFHNNAVGGKPASQHLEGRAADIRAASFTSTQLHGLIVRLWQAGKLPRLGGLGVYDRFVHVDVREVADGRLARWDERGNNVQQTA